MVLKENLSLIVLATVGLFCVLLFLFFVKYFQGTWVKRVRIPRQLPTNGLLFVVVSVSTMLSHNSLFPRIKLFDEYFEYRIILKKKIFYKNISKIEIEKFKFIPKSIVVCLNNGGRLWITPGKEDNLNSLLDFFNGKIGLLHKQAQK